MEKTSFVDINKKNNGKIILFGSGNIAKKTIRKIGVDRIDFIVDNSKNLQGTKFEGFDVLNPDKIYKNCFVIICSTAISDISQQLIELGLKGGQDFVISPILNDLIIIDELENLKSTFYFTSGTVPKKSDKYGGGLYKCTVNGLKHTLEKVYSGPCYGAIKVDNEIIFVDTDQGVFGYDGVEVYKKTSLPTGSRAHGISFNQENKRYYITCSYFDSVLELDEKFAISREFSLSNKKERSGEAAHHCNDNYSMNNSLFVSMFSSTGNWKNDSFDGCIAEFDIQTGERLRDVFTGLYMPHNIKLFDGSLHILDSLPGHLRFNNFSIQGTFPAFTRGLDYKDGLYYLGQSKNRNYSKVVGISNNISIDCGVVVFNPILKVSRFLQFPYEIGEIHSVVTI